MLNGKAQERDDILRKLSRIVEAYVDFERGIDVDLSHFDLSFSLADYRREHGLSDKADGYGGTGSRAADPAVSIVLCKPLAVLKCDYLFI